MIRCVRYLLSILLSVVGALVIPPCSHSEIALSQISSKLSISANLRVRGEFWDWFKVNGPHDPSYSFLGTIARGTLAWKDELFDLVLEGQSSSLIGLPDDATAPAPQGPLGLGAVYFGHNRRQDDTAVFLKQGFLLIKSLGFPGLTLKGGRFEFSEGNEVLTKEPTLDWLKNMRLSQRLIGPFGWSHIGRAFNGGVASVTCGPLNVTLMASHPTQGGFDLAGMKDMDEIDLLYTAVNLTHPGFAPNSDARFFYIYQKIG
ncbi:MAG: hypothetical protein AB7G75_37650 [Candidatus Binatia bacterium]